MKLSLAVFFLSAGLALPVRLLSWEGAFFDFFEVSHSTRASAIGGLHSALADDESTLFSNPAGFRSVEPRFTVSQTSLSLYESAAEIAAEVFSGASPSTTAQRNGTFDLLGPISLSYVGKGWGFGLYSTSNVRFTSQEVPVPSASEVIEETLLLIGGRSFRIPLPEGSPSTLDLGLSLVLFTGGRTLSYTDIRQVFLGSTDVLTMLADAAFYQSVMGAGIEFGVHYAYKDRFAIAVAGRNLSFEQIRVFGSFVDYLAGSPSSPSYNVLPLDLSAGILFRPPLGRLNRAISDLLFLADYHNIFDFLIYPAGATNPLLHIGLGVELKLLDVISLRGGFYQMLPSLGFGLDLTILTLDLAYYGRELSKEPGGYPVYCFALGVEFKL